MRNLVLVITLCITTVALARGTYQEPMAFLQDVYNTEPPPPQVIWLTGELKQQATDLLGHDYHSLRIRYWNKDKRSTWILDEIGKDQAITTGIVIEQSKIIQLKVLVFRESRGGEVRYSFFTDQFKDTKLNNKNKLNRHIDNISGATLSVRALVKQGPTGFITGSTHQHKSCHTVENIAQNYVRFMCGTATSGSQ